LIALLLAVGGAAVYYTGLPVWFAGVFALAIVFLQYAVNPWFIQWLVPATEIRRTAEGYDTDLPLGEIVALRAKDAGIPLPRLGVVDDGTPNAFTFGRTPRDARVWVTRGLLERLDRDELDAVVAHEIGHIKNWDFVVMTIAAAIPLALYFVYLSFRNADRQLKAVALAAYVAYVVSQFLLLALSRARELAADHWSCQSTEDGDALASALVKVAYGMGQVRNEHRAELELLMAQGKAEKKQARKLDRHYRRAQSLRAMGIFDPSQVDALQAAVGRGIDGPRAIAAMRWDVANPWGATLEKLSSHPLVARRIQVLAESGLPGAPYRWEGLRRNAVVSPAVRRTLVGQWAGELFIAVAPWAMLIAVGAFGLFNGSATMIGAAVAASGILLLFKQVLRYPGRFEPVEEITEMLNRIDASPVRGIPIQVEGQLIGRGTPGYLLSPDMVIQDGSGFVPLLYRQPIPFARAWFGLTKVKGLLGQRAVATGWYRRTPSPVIELKTVRAAARPTVMCWEWAARYVASGTVLLIGLLILAVSAGG
jgi:Zn-dependent protease with chaperone function